MRRYSRNITAALGLAVAIGVAAQAATTNFSTDVAAAIDASLAFFRAQNYFTTGGNANAQGLVLLALLEKHSSADFNAPILGYSGLTGNNGNLQTSTFGTDTCHGGAPPAACPSGDKLLAQYAIQRMLNSNQFQFAYYDGNYMLAFSLYLKTGGQPNVPNSGGFGATPLTVGTGSVKAKLDAMVDRTLTAQCGGAAAPGSNAGFWYYSGCGQDASTTQYAAGGLAAARDFYIFNGTDAARVASIGTALTKVRNAYAMNFGAQSGNEGGWGYSVTNGAGHQQTASGMWISELGGANINDVAIQKAINFERNHYQYANNLSQDNGWGNRSYGYHLFSSSKAFSILEADNTVPNAGNTTTNDLGDDPAAGDRAHQRNPLADGCARLANFGVAGCAGGANATPYTNESPRWYYDYAYTIMSRQMASGQHSEAFTGNDFWETVSNQAYYTLVLERSLGGVNAVPNCTAANSYAEIVMDGAHSYADVTIGPVTDPDGEVLTVKVDSAMMDENDLQWGPTFPFPAVITAPNGVQSPAGGGTVTGLIKVRAERNGLRQSPGNGRVYHIKFTARDGSGGACSAEAVVGVRFLATQAPVDNGSLFDATQQIPQ